MSSFLGQKKNSLGCLADLTSDMRWNREEFISEINSRSDVLQRIGLSVGDRILLMGGNKLKFFADLFAVWNQGGSAIVIDPELPVLQKDRICEFAEAKFALSDSSTLHAAPSRCSVIDLSQEKSVSTSKLSAIHKANKSNSAEALILFTSGSTGIPKGVVLSHQALNYRIRTNREKIAFNENWTALCTLPIHFGHGLIGNCLTFLSGNCSLFLIDSESSALGDLGRIIDSHSVNFFSSVPSLWNIVARRSDSPSKKSLKRIHIGSAPLNQLVWKDVINWCGMPNVVNMYGMTETANWFTGASPINSEPLDGWVGHPWGGETKVFTEEGRFERFGRGEIYVSTPSMMTGYLKQTETTQKVLQDGWFRTGDTGIIDPSLGIILSGRRKFEINRGGLKVQPEDINNVLIQHPEISECFSFGIPDDVAGELVGVAVVVEPGSRPELSALKNWCARLLSKEKIPQMWFKLNSIPKTSRGKTDREKLIEQCISGRTNRFR